ncbi:hypothetical protein TEA_003286 [Camellia sinensis var. sinensis]|uniref:Legumain prodomain domain-containing protein n=1 Tax=Camellia sinensis var. sinensis TaxID=542762 RepID=A0A4S4DN54_CAMSN|nr:hypothetical protein TEA_003286 [Camellia sinensis var. sinensis]
MEWNGMGNHSFHSLTSGFDFDFDFDFIWEYYIGCLFRNMGYNLFYRAYVHLQSGETVNGFGALLHNFNVLLSNVRAGDMPMHRKKPLQDVLGCIRHRCWRRFRDVELGCSSSEENTSLGVDRSVIRRRKLIRKRKDRPGSTFYPLRQVPKNRYGSHNHHHHHHHHLRLKTREVSVHVKGRSQGAKYSRQLQMRKLSNIRREAVLFKKRRFSFSLESQQLYGHSFKLSSEETGSHHVGMKGTRWAVLVAGSNGYENYRHQADVCHAYQLLRKGGLKDENIIVFMYDDIAFNVQNPRPGIIINRPQGEDVYEGVPKDYTGHNANVHNLYAVILANKTALTGGSGKVLDSGPEDHIFIYYTDHGGPGVLDYNCFLNSFSLESQQLHGHSFKLSSEETGSHHVGMKGTRWAVLVAGSNGYENYRHQADVCHAYQLLRKGGLKDENIIVFMYDDIAFNVQNPRPGIIINRPQGEDVYEGVPKDYTGHNANVHNLYAVILANKTALTGGSGKVLDSGPEDHIFIYYTDHGSPGVLAMPYDDYVYADDLIDVLKKKHESNTFKSMVFYLEACESGSMFEGLLPEGLNIYATTAANAVESSFVTYCPDDYPYVAPEYDTCLGDLYSVSWMEDSDKHDLRTETLEQQYEVVRRRTSNEYPENGSHVMQYGNLRLRKKSLYDYLGTNPANENYTYMRHDSSTSISKPVSQNDADLLHFWHKFRKAPKGSEKKLEAQKQLIDELNQRLHIDHIMMFIAKLLFESENGLLMLETVRPAGQPLVDDWNCLKTLVSFTNLFHAFVRTYKEHCGSLSRYGMTYMRAIANMCNAGVKMEQMAMASAQACMGTTLIHAAPSTMN